MKVLVKKSKKGKNKFVKVIASIDGSPLASPIKYEENEAKNGERLKLS
jgi:hypothetical protein